MNNNTTTDNRIALLGRMGRYLGSGEQDWQNAMYRAAAANAWFTPEHIQLAVDNIVACYLQPGALADWAAQYPAPAVARTVGIVMAGNIPLVGFHDFLCGYVSGHRLMVKLSSKDDVLLRFIIDKLSEWDPETREQVNIADRLNGCDAYIATGSNNTARYFEQYFGKYPHIIRKNRTSVAILDGAETDDELALLADDVYQFYGLGCRNITQLCVPREYDFARLLRIFNRYNHYADLNKYKNNYDYHLAIYLLNRVPYMSNESLLMVENELPFSAVSVLHYRFYDNYETIVKSIKSSDDIQAIAGHGFIPFGQSQRPSLDDYADGVDTMRFLTSL